MRVTTLGRKASTFVRLPMICEGRDPACLPVDDEKYRLRPGDRVVVQRWRRFDLAGRRFRLDLEIQARVKR